MLVNMHGNTVEYFTRGFSNNEAMFTIQKHLGLNVFMYNKLSYPIMIVFYSM